MELGTLLRTSAALVSAVTMMAACGGASTESSEVIPPQDDALVAAGEALYQLSCAECHGDDLRGTDRGPSHLSSVYRPSHHADGSFVLAAKVGVRQHHWRFGDMPAVPGLSNADLDAIVAFVRDQQRSKGFEPYPP